MLLPIDVLCLLGYGIKFAEYKKEHEFVWESKFARFHYREKLCKKCLLNFIFIVIVESILCFCNLFSVYNVILINFSLSSALVFLVFCISFFWFYFYKNYLTKTHFVFCVLIHISLYKSGGDFCICLIVCWYLHIYQLKIGSIALTYEQVL